MELITRALKFTAARNIVMNAGGNISTGSMENTTLLAGKNRIVRPYRKTQPHQ
ncbi:hypothetical protein [Ewingella americana]|uniref:hypothetical protein n=1 Tax=Ewingella americana TaxID=41202 RepID=UPI00163B38ED|nr:hypothetical protein [Ewingella americana]QMV50374.1 hypothetical protein GXP68_02665 [Ewingella americana]